MSSSLFISKLRARDVAAIGSSHRSDAPAVPAWDTCIRVNSAQETAQKAGIPGRRRISRPGRQ
jgi:hypothetical protein